MDTSRFVRMFQCDTARIIQSGRRMFLIIGHRRSTKDDAGQWERNGEPYDFEYVAEQVVASGDTEAELLASAKEYKRLLGMTMEQYLVELFPTALREMESLVGD